MKKVFFFLFATILFFSSCVKDAATGTSTINFQLKAATSAINGAGIVWSAGTAGVANAKIEAKKNDSSSVEYKTAPNAQIDLFAAVNISNVSVPAGTFRNVEFHSELKAINSKPSLHLEGNYTAGGVTTPVTFDVNTDITVKSKRDSIIIGTSATTYTALTTVTLVTLTQDVTEAEMKVADRASGKIVISATSSSTIYNKMLANLAKLQVVDFH